MDKGARSWDPHPPTAVRAHPREPTRGTAPQARGGSPRPDHDERRRRQSWQVASRALSGSVVRAAVYYGPGDVRFEDMPVPVAGEGELLVDVATVGICGSDVGEYVHEPHFFPVKKRHPFSGHLGPTIPGHEFSGVVAAVGPGVDGFAVGDLVASGAGVSCGHCPACRRGATNMCETYWTVGLHTHGAMAEQVTVPASCCLNL